LPFIDLVRAVGAQLIVWHHLAFYGPLAERAYAAAPTVFDWLVDYARMAVQGFLVMGGFFTARTFSRIDVVDRRCVLKTLRSRYLRIGLPYWVTLIVAVAASEVARQYMTDEAISARPSLGQIIAHVVLLHDLLDYEALSAGLWYLAIDFQLFVLTLFVLWGCQRGLSRFAEKHGMSVWQLSLFASAPIAVLSLIWFNRLSHLDEWAIYFFASYYLGLLLHEAVVSPAMTRWVVGGSMLAIGVGLVDSRPRIVVAAAVALLVLFARKTELLQRWPNSRVISYLGRSSYSLFLIHFPILLVINAWGSRYFTSSAWAVVGLLMAYAVSLMFAALLYHGVEKRLR
jgi:peptidoglycan/LPS O-acetylase OafA/YrhL